MKKHAHCASSIIIYAMTHIATQLAKLFRINHDIRQLMCMVLVLDSFRKNRLISKSNEYNSALFNGQASVQCSSIRKHFGVTNWARQLDTGQVGFTGCGGRRQSTTER